MDFWQFMILMAVLFGGIVVICDHLKRISQHVYAILGNLNDKAVSEGRNRHI